jgi:hypothetical protein
MADLTALDPVRTYMGGTRVQKLHWMLLEGTSWKAVIEKLNKHS